MLSGGGMIRLRRPLISPVELSEAKLPRVEGCMNTPHQPVNQYIAPLFPLRQWKTSLMMVFGMNMELSSWLVGSLAGWFDGSMNNNTFSNNKNIIWLRRTRAGVDLAR